MADAARAFGVWARTREAAARQEMAGRQWRRTVLTSVLGFDFEVPAPSAAATYGDARTKCSRGT